MTAGSGRHVLEIPGAPDFPDRTLRPVDQPTIARRGPKAQRVDLGVLDGLEAVLGSEAGHAESPSRTEPAAHRLTRAP
jgi:alanine-glyoxylate transaminase / serine-glyoxylate transaminase / serine-pyruvate transaminase